MESEKTKLIINLSSGVAFQLFVYFCYKIKIMTVKELYDHITSHMTPEQALMKLLESTLIKYEKLKVADDETLVHPLFIISMAAWDMGWDLALEKDQEDVRGICVGTKEYLKTVFP